MAKKNAGPTEPERPRLKGPRGNAHELIRRQVAAGEQLCASATSPASAPEFAERQKCWRDYTRDLLRSLFTSDEIAKEFDRYPSNAWDANSHRYLRNLKWEHDRHLVN